jgi:excisionase family DNA binding protein
MIPHFPKVNSFSFLPRSSITKINLAKLGGEMGTPNLVTVKEIEKILKLSSSTIYHLAANGQIPAFKIGDSWRFDIEEVTRFIMSQKGVFEKKAATA